MIAKSDESESLEVGKFGDILATTATIFEREFSSQDSSEQNLNNKDTGLGLANIQITLCVLVACISNDEKDR